MKKSGWWYPSWQRYVCITITIISFVSFKHLHAQSSTVYDAIIMQFCFVRYFNSWNVSKPSRFAFAVDNLAEPSCWMLFIPRIANVLMIVTALANTDHFHVLNHISPHPNLIHTTYTRTSIPLTCAHTKHTHAHMQSAYILCSFHNSIIVIVAALCIVVLSHYH